MDITEKLNENVMEHLRTVPDVDTNFKIINSFIVDIQADLYIDYHYLQQKGIIFLLKKLRYGNLKYIPTDILKNKLNNVALYADLINGFSDKIIINEGNINIIFQDAYYQSLLNLNMLINIEND